MDKVHFNLLLVMLIFGIFETVPAKVKTERPHPTEKLTYKTIDDIQLKLHFFYPENHARKDKTACVVFFFGGSWNIGSPRQFYQHCNYLASRGMVAVSAEYRIHSKHGTTPFECVKDGKSAIRWINEQ